MWAVRKNPADLNTDQRTSQAGLEKANDEPYRAYLLKEQLREVFHVKGVRGRKLLTGWTGWARDCGIAEFEKLGRTIERYRPSIRNTLDHNVTNARSEATNTHIRACAQPVSASLGEVSARGIVFSAGSVTGDSWRDEG